MQVVLLCDVAIASQCTFHSCFCRMSCGTIVFHIHVTAACASFYYGTGFLIIVTLAVNLLCTMTCAGFPRNVVLTFHAHVYTNYIWCTFQTTSDNCHSNVVYSGCQLPRLHFLYLRSFMALLLGKLCMHSKLMMVIHWFCYQ